MRYVGGIDETGAADRRPRPARRPAEGPVRRRRRSRRQGRGAARGRRDLPARARRRPGAPPIAGGGIRPSRARPAPAPRPPICSYGKTTEKLRETDSLRTRPAPRDPCSRPAPSCPRPRRRPPTLTITLPPTTPCRSCSFSANSVRWIRIGLPPPIAAIPDSIPAIPVIIGELATSDSVHRLLAAPVGRRRHRAAAEHPHHPGRLAAVGRLLARPSRRRRRQELRQAL